jgi:thiamine pyrophosphate-dependent acetolactate synthase large subunit-like protein
MCIQELSTCLQYNTPIKILSLNNRYLGMVRQWQELTTRAATATATWTRCPTS